MVSQYMWHPCRCILMVMHGIFAFPTACIIGMYTVHITSLGNHHVILTRVSGGASILFVCVMRVPSWWLGEYINPFKDGHVSPNRTVIQRYVLPGRDCKINQCYNKLKGGYQDSVNKCSPMITILHAMLVESMRSRKIGCIGSSSYIDTFRCGSTEEHVIVIRNSSHASQTPLKQTSSATLKRMEFIGSTTQRIRPRR